MGQTHRQRPGRRPSSSCTSTTSRCSLPTARTRDYGRVLDMRDGHPPSRPGVVDAGGQARAGAVVPAGLARAPPRARQCRYEVTVDRPAPVVVASRVIQPGRRAAATRERPAPARPAAVQRRPGRRRSTGWSPTPTTGRIVLGYRAPAAAWCWAWRSTTSSRRPAPQWSRPRRARRRPRCWSRSTPSPGCPSGWSSTPPTRARARRAAEELAARCARTLERVRHAGFPALAGGAAGQPRPLLGAGRRRGARRGATRSDCSRPSAGTSSSWRRRPGGPRAPASRPRASPATAYDGHYFWDTEAYVLPFLAYTQPRIARNLLRFRHSMLPTGAGAGGDAGPARRHSSRGARSTARRRPRTSRRAPRSTTSTPTSPTPSAATSTSAATSDFLVEVGAEMLVETARMWADLGFYGEDGRFHIHGVTGPDEYTTVVNDNAYTNLMARLNLNYAAAALRRLAVERPDGVRARSASSCGLDPSEPAAWERAADPMYVPHDAATGITPQDDAFLEREVWDLAATPAEQFPLLLHFHPLVDLPAPGAEAGRRGDGDVPARQRVHPRAEAPQLRVLRPAHHRRLVAVGQRAEHRRRRDRRGGRRRPVLRLRPG